MDVFYTIVSTKLISCFSIFRQKVILFPAACINQLTVLDFMKKDVSNVASFHKIFSQPLQIIDASWLRRTVKRKTLKTRTFFGKIVVGRSLRTVRKSTMDWKQCFFFTKLNPKTNQFKVFTTKTDDIYFHACCKLELILRSGNQLQVFVTVNNKWQYENDNNMVRLFPIKKWNISSLVPALLSDKNIF